MIHNTRWSKNGLNGFSFILIHLRIVFSFRILYTIQCNNIIMKYTFEKRKLNYPYP
jgi:hypothetical protein